MTYVNFICFNPILQILFNSHNIPRKSVLRFPSYGQVKGISEKLKFTEDISKKQIISNLCWSTPEVLAFTIMVYCGYILTVSEGYIKSNAWNSLLRDFCWLEVGPKCYCNCKISQLAEMVQFFSLYSEKLRPREMELLAWSHRKSTVKIGRVFGSLPSPENSIGIRIKISLHEAQSQPMIHQTSGATHLQPRECVIMRVWGYLAPGW